MKKKSDTKTKIGSAEKKGGFNTPIPTSVRPAPPQGQDPEDSAPRPSPSTVPPREFEIPRRIRVTRFDRVRYSYGRTINTGNYESARIDVGMSSDVQPGETFNEAMDSIREKVVKEVLDGVREIKGVK